jgi:hypothetical protein
MDIVKKHGLLMSGVLRNYPSKGTKRSLEFTVGRNSYCFLRCQCGYKVRVVNDSIDGFDHSSFRPLEIPDSRLDRDVL